MPCLQPSNVFLDSEGSSYLGDYGAAVKQKEPVREWTDVFMPTDIDSRMLTAAHPCIDAMALAATVLTALRKMPGTRGQQGHQGMATPEPFTLQELREGAQRVENGELRQLLTALTQA
jgi:hypothetical protein